MSMTTTTTTTIVECSKTIFLFTFIQLPDKNISSLVKYYYSWKKTRTRTSVMDRQEKLKTKEGSENGSSENGSNDDSDSEDKVCQMRFSIIYREFRLELQFSVWLLFCSLCSVAIYTIQIPTTKIVFFSYCLLLHSYVQHIDHWNTTIRLADVFFFYVCVWKYRITFVVMDTICQAHTPNELFYCALLNLWNAHNNIELTKCLTFGSDVSGSRLNCVSEHTHSNHFFPSKFNDGSEQIKTQTKDRKILFIVCFSFCDSWPAPQFYLDLYTGLICKLISLMSECTYTVCMSLSMIFCFTFSLSFSLSLFILISVYFRWIVLVTTISIRNQF